jgi:hypothetical protein
MNNGLVPIYLSIYFWFISKQWLWIEVFAAFVNVLCIIGIFFMPESPKFLMSVKHWDRARESLSAIARMNGKGEFKGKFDRERVDNHSMGLFTPNLPRGGVNTTSDNLTDD